MEKGLRKGEEAADKPEEEKGNFSRARAAQLWPLTKTALADMRKGLAVGAIEAKQYSPLTLAYLGDAVYELLIRTVVVAEGNASVNKLNRRASNLSKASAQSDMVKALIKCFNEEEVAVYKRGRNAHSYTRAKNATVGDYRRATGLEAVFGFLYLQGKIDRIIELICTGLAASEYPDKRKEL